MVIYGINPAVEALRAGRVEEMWVSARLSQRLVRVVDLARRSGVTVHRIEATKLDEMARGGRHQGVAVAVAQRDGYTVGDLVTGALGVPLIVVLDGVEDPQNLGAVARAAEAAGVDGVVYHTRRAAPAGPAAAKASAGALVHLKLAPVVNVSRALEELKALGVWTVGLDAAADRPYHSLDLTLPTALVVGEEGKGLRRLVRERCDWLASIPMGGHVSSLNVSVATGVALFEALRQRTVKDLTPGDAK